MDAHALKELKARALDSKKRKRVRPNALKPETATPDDLEEGEIDDSAVTASNAGAGRVATTTATAAPLPPAPVLARSAAAAAANPPPIPTPTSSRTPSSSSSALSAVREESKRVIAELLSYGVPPTYLLSIGVSHSLLATTFQDLDLHLTLPPPPTPAADASPAPTLTDSQPVSLVDLAALEARKRQELLARKAAIRNRNEQRAQSLESELDSLFSAVAAPARAVAAQNGSQQPAPPPPRDPGEAAAEAVLLKRKKRQQKNAARKKRKLEAAASSAAQPVSSSVSGPAPKPLAATNASRSAAYPIRRPKAVELESDPTARLSSTSLMQGRRGRAFINNEPVRLVIDLSDDDD